MRELGNERTLISSAVTFRSLVRSVFRPEVELRQRKRGIRKRHESGKDDNGQWENGRTDDDTRAAFLGVTVDLLQPRVEVLKGFPKVSLHPSEGSGEEDT